MACIFSCNPQTWDVIFSKHNLKKCNFLSIHFKSQFSSVQFSRSVMSDSLRPQHTRPPCPSPTPRVYSNSCPLSQGCHPAISSSVVPFSSCPLISPSIRVFILKDLLNPLRLWVCPVSSIAVIAMIGRALFHTDRVAPWSRTGSWAAWRRRCSNGPVTGFPSLPIAFLLSAAAKMDSL